MQGLGFQFDACIDINVAALATGTVTGKRVHMVDCQAIDFVYVTGAASAGTDTITLALKEHTANTGGTSTALAAIGDVYYKSTAANLAGTEAWSFLDNRSAGVKQNSLALANTGVLPAANAGIIVFSVDADALDAGYAWLSVDLSGLTSTNTRPGTLLAVRSGLKVMRDPALLAQPNA